MEDLARYGLAWNLVNEVFEYRINLQRQGYYMGQEWVDAVHYNRISAPTKTALHSARREAKTAWKALCSTGNNLNTELDLDIAHNAVVETSVVFGRLMFLLTNNYPLSKKDMIQAVTLAFDTTETFLFRMAAVRDLDRDSVAKCYMHYLETKWDFLFGKICPSGAILQVRKRKIEEHFAVSLAA